MNQIKRDVVLKIDAHLATLNMCLFDYTPKKRGLCSCGTTVKRSAVGLTVVEQFQIGLMVE